jgi:ureidoglycolate dehydrogenase (NAD+)
MLSADSATGGAMTEKDIRVDALQLQELIKQILLSAGVCEGNSRIVADSITTAELSGFHSHGVIRIPHYIKRLRMGSLNKNPDIRVLRKTGNTALVDGDHGMGHAVAHFAMQEAIKLAENGVGFVGVTNSSHFGIAGYTAIQAVKKDMIGIVVSHTDVAVIPFGGKRPAVGTNPLAVAIPTDREYPVLLDMATSAASLGKILVAKSKGERIPPDWAVDEEGVPTTDPEKVKYLMPMAGPKGYALALIFDILSGPLTGSLFGKRLPKMYGDYEKHRRMGHFIGAIKVENFVPIDEFKKNVGALIDEIHDTPLAQGFERIMVPGEKEYLTQMQYEKEGIPIPSETAKELRAVAQELGITFPSPTR